MAAIHQLNSEAMPRSINDKNGVFIVLDIGLDYIRPFANENHETSILKLTPILYHALSGS
eukprot:scaffold1593_cov170-Ochromonas_danica.AAC.5